MNNDYSSPKGLRDEWTLLLHSFLDNNSVKPELFQQLKNIDVSSVKKELSSKRKKLNQGIEKIKIKIEQVNTVIENLELVGSDTTGLWKEIDFLNNEGEKISEEIFMLDGKIKKIHDLQEQVA
ncbi:MAG: hypothetical protein H7328_08875 [Bdellovibrio sp.]|nr:hypothetical protein [Bdellovibrio sp.]